MYRRDLGLTLAAVEERRKEAFGLLDLCFRLTQAIPRDKDASHYKRSLFIIYKHYLLNAKPDNLHQANMLTAVSMYRL
jgi:hypothetical protein